MKRKLVLSLACLIAGSFLLSGCGKKEVIELTVWTPGEDIEAVAESVENFKDYYKKDAEFKIIINEEGVMGTRDLLLSKTPAHPDVFRYADDQFVDLYNAGVLHLLDDGKDDIIERNGGIDAPIISSVVVDDGLYGAPTTASNGFFLFYDTRVLNENDVKDLDTLLDKCEKQGKHFAMDFSSGWYTYAFFGAAGMSVNINDEGTHNVCDYNRTDGDITGLDVAQAMVEIAKHKGFKDVGNAVMMDDAREGGAAALVSGSWHNAELTEIWEGNVGAAKLPTCTIKDQQLQMRSFAGYTYYGVHQDSASPEWAEKLANWITDYNTQLARYRVSGDCPSNINAAKNKEVQASPMIVAFFDQSQYSTAQHILNPYWDAMSIFGSVVGSGNQRNLDLQQLLDQTVDLIEE